MICMVLLKRDFLEFVYLSALFGGSIVSGRAVVNYRGLLLEEARPDSDLGTCAESCVPREQRGRARMSRWLRPLHIRSRPGHRRSLKQQYLLRVVLVIFYVFVSCKPCCSCLLVLINDNRITMDHEHVCVGQCRQELLQLGTILEHHGGHLAEVLGVADVAAIPGRELTA